MVFLWNFSQLRDSINSTQQQDLQQEQEPVAITSSSSPTLFYACATEASLASAHSTPTPPSVHTLKDLANIRMEDRNNSAAARCSYNIRNSKPALASMAILINSNSSLYFSYNWNCHFKRANHSISSIVSVKLQKIFFCRNSLSIEWFLGPRAIVKTLILSGPSRGWFTTATAAPRWGSPPRAVQRSARPQWWPEKMARWHQIAWRRKEVKNAGRVDWRKIRYISKVKYLMYPPTATKLI